MSFRTQQLKADAKAARFAATASRHDDKGADDLRKLAAHAHVATHHALELNSPEAHKMAVQAHDAVSDAHKDLAASCAEEPEAKTTKRK